MISVITWPDVININFEAYNLVVVCEMLSKITFSGNDDDDDESTGQEAICSVLEVQGSHLRSRGKKIFSIFKGVHRITVGRRIIA